MSVMTQEQVRALVGRGGVKADAGRPAPPVPPRTVRLPWPPSVNDYWTRTKRGNRLSERAKRFHAEATAEWLTRGAPTFGEAEVRLLVDLYPPADHRQHDTDNTTKAIGDALQKCGVLADDHQIAWWDLRRRFRSGKGFVDVTIERLSEHDSEATR